jgi:putative flippase GtrA
LKASRARAARGRKYLETAPALLTGSPYPSARPRDWYQAPVPGFHRLGPETKRIVKFAIVGVCNTAVALVSYAILLELGVEYVVAGAIGWILGVLNGYTWHRFWTFDRVGHEMSLLVRYTAVGALGLSLNTGLLALWISVVGIAELPAEFLALPVVVLTTFLVNRFWVFREHVSEGVAQLGER